MMRPQRASTADVRACPTSPEIVESGRLSGCVTALSNHQEVGTPASCSTPGPVDAGVASASVGGAGVGGASLSPVWRRGARGVVQQQEAPVGRLKWDLDAEIQSAR